MNYEDYRKLYSQALRLDDEFRTVDIPVEVGPEETEDQAFMRFLLDQDFIEVRSDQWRITDRDRVKEYDPNLLKILDAMIMSKERADLDELVEIGFLFMTADEHGNIVYELTDAGKGYVEEED
jgi:hypothetical protein